MSKITASMVKSLRAATGAGMMDCKKALNEAEGDEERARELLRKRGLASAKKKAGRAATEGLVHAYIDDSGSVGVLLEVNCETDFVSGTDDFKSFVGDVASHIAQANPSAVRSEDGQGLMEQSYTHDSNQTVADVQTAIVAKLGENISIRRFDRFLGEGGIVHAYIHGGGRVGVLLDVACDSDDVAGAEEFKSFVHGVAMHIAATNPLAVARDDISEADLANERRILTEQALASGKPEAVVEKMVTGRMRKFYEENCLLDQAFVLDTDRSVGAVQAALVKSLGGAIAIRRFTRFVCGEGLEKKVDDFAAEVASMTGA